MAIYTWKSRYKDPEYAKKWWARNKERVMALKRSRYNEVRSNYCRTPKGRFNSLIRCAKKRGITVDMTLEQYQALDRSKGCFYCFGELPQTGCALDRVNVQLPYSLNNVVMCCKRCNMVKGSDHSLEETQVMIHALLDFQRLKKAS